MNLLLKNTIENSRFSPHMTSLLKSPPPGSPVFFIVTTSSALASSFNWYSGGLSARFSVPCFPGNPELWLMSSPESRPSAGCLVMRRSGGPEWLQGALHRLHSSILGLPGLSLRISAFCHGLFSESLGDWHTHPWSLQCL